MADFLNAVASWPNLFSVLFVFGFAPGAVLRLLVLVYPKESLRRAELIAELYLVPRIERPVWVAQQAEVAIFEGLPQRLRAMRTKRAELASFIRRSKRTKIIVLVLATGASFMAATWAAMSWLLSDEPLLITVVYALALLASHVANRALVRTAALAVRELGLSRGR